MPEHYHRASGKKMSPWAIRMKRRGSAEDVKVPTTKKTRAERLTRRAALEARMTPAERRKAERKRVDAFMERRNAEMRPDPATPAAKRPSPPKPKKPKPLTPSIRHPFPQLTGPGGALGPKKRKK